MTHTTQHTSHAGRRRRTLKCTSLLLAFVLASLPLHVSAQKLYRINVEERPGSYPRTGSNRAHYESRVAFMSALAHNEEEANKTGKGQVGKGDNDSSTRHSTSPTTSTQTQPTPSSTIPRLNLGLNSTAIPDDNSNDATSRTATVAAPMLAGRSSSDEDDPMLWDPAEHIRRRHMLLDRYYASLEQGEAGEEEEDDDEEANGESVANNNKTSVKRMKKRALVGIQPVRGDTYDRQWVAAMSVGNPSQLFSVVFDTGSSDVWVASSACSTQQCTSLRRFNPSNSRTFTSLNQPWSINYADNTWTQGNLGKDDISVAGITIKQQTIGLATTILTKMDIDGIMGLGFDANSDIPGMKTPVTNMIAQGQIDEPIVSVWLNKATTRKDTSDGGMFIFGGMDTSLFYEPITYLPVTSDTQWQVGMNKVMAGNKVLTSDPPDAIIDTGASYIVFPESLATAFHRLIPNAHFDPLLGWQMPCSMASSRTIGDLTFVFDGVQFSVPFSDIVLLKSQYNGFCFSALDSWKEVDGHGGQSTIVLGDLFIKNQYVVYDYGKKKIGLARKVENSPGGIGLNSRNTAGMDRRSILKDPVGQGWRYAATTVAAGVLAAGAAGLTCGAF